MSEYHPPWNSRFGETVGERLEYWRRTSPDGIALISERQRITWSGLAEATDRLATALLRLGLRKGDRLAILAPNHPEAILSWYAAAKAGIVPVSLSVRYRQHELEHILTDSGAKAVVAVERFGGFPLADAVRSLRPPSLQHVITYPERAEGALSLQDLLEQTDAEPALLAASRPQSGDLLFLLYTSGTTGVPKGVPHTHDSILNNAKAVQEEVLHMDSGDVVILAMPFYHMIGHVIFIYLSLLVGARLVMMESYEARGFVDVLEREGVTVFAGVPTMLKLPVLRIADLQRRNLSALRLCVVTGFYTPPDQIRQFRDVYGATVLQLLGSTEAGCMTTTRPEDSDEVLTTTLGRPLSTTELKVVGEDGKETPPREPGELCFRGPSLCKGYWNRPDLTAQDFDAEGFWHSGDVGYRVDEQGNVRLVGRKKEVIKRGGLQIFPGEVEAFLLNLPGVEQAAVVSYPDEVLGEKVCAFVQPKPGAVLAEEQIREKFRDQLADYKVPDMIRIVENMPLLPSGKVDRRSLREALLKELGAKGSK